jgi:hypothetical protein
VSVFDICHKNPLTNHLCEKTENMKNETESGDLALQDGFHPDFNDPQANVILKSNDGQQFRVHDFFLKASR